MENKERLQQSIAQVNAIKEKLLSKTIGSATEDRIDIGDFIGTVGGLWKATTPFINYTLYINFTKGDIANVTTTDAGVTGIVDTYIPLQIILRYEGEKAVIDNEYILGKLETESETTYMIGTMISSDDELGFLETMIYDPATNTILAGDMVLSKVSDTYLQDKTVTENGSVFADIGFDGLLKVDVNVPEPTLISKEITENGTYNASDESADGYSSVTVNVASSGSGEFFDRTFANNTPEQISKVSALIAYNNMTSAEVAETFGWNIGDTTKITLSTDEVIEMRIIGFNHDDKSDGSGKAGITLDMTHCLAIRYTMNDTKTNAGGYPASKMKTTTLPTIKATLPQEWQDVIKMVDKKSANGGNSNYSAILTTSEDLFLLSEYELFGRTSQAQNGSQEGTVYEYWQGKTDEDRIKDYGSNGPWYRWLRSSSQQSTGQFCAVYNNSSYATNNNNAHSSAAVSFAFCV